MDMIKQQLLFVAITFLGGMAIMLCYTVLRLLRFLVSHNKVVVWIEDFLFWGIISIPCFLLFFYGNYGELRWYGIVAVFWGGLVFEKKIYQKVKRKIDKCMVKIHKKMKKISKNDCNMKENSL